ncbi:MAG: DnaA regulatory inactivator Hda [Casimicrobiaceae bacterium]
MEQLVFDLTSPPPPTLKNFLLGRNAEALAALALFAAAATRETSIVLWGAPGAGKTHLLQATVAAVVSPQTARYYARPDALAAVSADSNVLLAIDDVESADAVAQGQLFTLYNEFAASGARLVVAGALPPARMPLRDDLRTRLSSGLIYEILPLADADKAAALEAHARARGFVLAEDVIAYLLAHGRRDMPSLLALLAALDRHALATKRAVTVPLLKSWLQRAEAAANMRE